MVTTSMEFNRKTNIGEYRVSERVQGAKPYDERVSFDTAQSLVIPSQAFTTAAGEQQQQNVVQTALDPDKKSIMNKIMPQKSYKGPGGDMGNLKRDANKTITDGANVSRRANLGMQETKRQVGEFQQDWKQAKHEALDALKDAAEGMGVDPAAAVDAFVPEDGANKATALAYIALESMTSGAGTLATMGAGKTAITEFSQKNNLTAKQKEDMLVKMKEELTAGPSPAQDSRPIAHPLRLLGSDDNKPKWENATTQDLKEFLAADVNGTDQPEMQELMEMESKFKSDLDNHAFVARNYGNNVTAEKIEAAVSAGNEGVARTARAGRIIQFDSIHAKLTGDSVATVSGGVSMDDISPDQDISGIDNKLILSSVNYPEISREVGAHMEAEMSSYTAA